MSHGVPYFNWRDGRPRWQPSQVMRDAGWTGRDLKDGKGLWLPLDMALDLARDLNRRAGVLAGKRVERYSAAAPTRGYVYFLWVGDHIKIGFSIEPIHRARGLLTGIAEDIRMLAAVRGSRADEAALHKRLRAHRKQGEWFADHHVVRDVCARCVAAGRVQNKEGQTFDHLTHSDGQTRSPSVLSKGSKSLKSLVGAPGLEPGTR